MNWVRGESGTCGSRFTGEITKVLMAVTNVTFATMSACEKSSAVFHHKFPVISHRNSSHVTFKTPPHRIHKDPTDHAQRGT